MGWTGTYTDRPAHEVVTEEIEWHFEGQRQRHKVLKRSGRYYAVENLETGEVWALVALVQRGEGMVYTKLVDETMGPYERDCPPAILDLLTDIDDPPAHQYAVEWRADCRRNAAIKAAMPKLKAGDTIKVASPIKFGDGIERDTFTFIKRFTFKDRHGWLIRLPKDWKRRYEWVVTL